ncbi:MAG: TetR/AcrR family transcriptional regulator, partial [Paludibacteraceae bacterium]
MSKTTREEILKKATSLFLKNGYEQTSLTDIANAVGLQKPSLYSRFKSKEDIFRKVVEYYLVNMQKPDKKFGTTTDKSMKEFIEYYLSRVDVCMRTYDKDI